MPMASRSSPVGVPITGVVSLADLEVQPIDVVYLIRKKVDATGASELESRVRDVFARDATLSDGTIVHIEFAEAGPGPATIRSFAEILPFADGIRELIGRARPLHAQDYAAPAKTKAAAAENPGHVDIVELKTRVVGIRTASEFALCVTGDGDDAGANAGHAGGDRRSARGDEGCCRCRLRAQLPGVGGRQRYGGLQERSSRRASRCSPGTRPSPIWIPRISLR